MISTPHEIPNPHSLPLPSLHTSPPSFPPLIDSTSDSLLPRLISRQPNTPEDTTNLGHLKILQLNCHISKEITLSVLNHSSDFFFLLLQEPWINTFTLLPPPGWRCFVSFEHRLKNWNNRHHTCIYVSKRLGSQNINQLSGGGQLLLGLDISLPQNKLL